MNIENKDELRIQSFRFVRLSRTGGCGLGWAMRRSFRSIAGHGFVLSNFCSAEQTNVFAAGGKNSSKHMADIASKVG